MSPDYSLCHEITQFCQDWASVLLQNARQFQQSGPRRRTMKLPRRKFLQFAGAAAVAPTFLRVATAQTYPSRPITMIVPFPAGAGYDTIGRIVAERMRASLGQPIIIENVGGADGTIGVGRAARATPDGNTIVVGGLSVHVLNGALYSLPYDVVNDFIPISPLAESSLVLFSRKGFPADDLPELIDCHFDTPLQIPLVRAGSIKAFAVTSDTRLAVAPNIPTFAEMGLPGVSYTGWFALFAPRGTPKDIIAKLNAAAVGALADPAVRSRIADLGYDIFPHERQTPEALGALQKADAEKWWPIINELGIKAISLNDPQL